MGTITVLRPSATSSGVGWTPSTGTLHGVTSDDSDATYATWGGSGSALILATPVDSPPGGERRHQVRLRVRGEDGDAWGAVRLASGALIAGAAAPFTSSPSTVTGAWGSGAPADGASILSVYLTGQTTGTRVQELYIDVDTRLAPTFTLQTLDGSGSSTTTITDTAQPIIRADSVDLDDLNAREYRYWVTLDGAIVWDTGITAGPAVNRQTTALENGSYVAHAQVWSTLGANTPYGSDEETLAFTVSIGLVPTPDAPTATPVPDTPLYEVEACMPYAGDFDGDQGYIEIQRVDCPMGGYMQMTGQVNSTEYASTPEPGATLTDLEITIRAGRDDDWRPAGDETWIAQYETAGNNRSWRLTIDAAGAGDPMRMGVPSLVWSSDGTSGTNQSAFATERMPVDPFGNITLRVFLDSDDGAGGWAVTFETMDETGAWVQLGDVVTNSGGGTATLFNSTADITVGKYLGEANRFNGRFYWAQVRDGRTGPILVSPDFTGRMAGTTSFTDDQANVWTIHSPAWITSDQRITSIAVLGPLDTDECGTYIDYSLPRTGIGATCTHQPDPCCSYYRARTIGRVDGHLQISAWSDAFNPGVPVGMVFMWPSTNASIPVGWERTTALDDRYPKGVPTSSTEPGTTGGATTHSHTAVQHTHLLTHSHTVAGATSAAVGTTNSTPNAAGALAVLGTHTHTIPDTDSQGVSSGGTVPDIGTATNDPARLAVIYVESNGAPLGLPASMLAPFPDITVPNWDDYTDATGRFLKGATAGGNGGATTASSIGNHTHSIAAHTHAAVPHTHNMTNTTSAANSANTLNAGPTSVVWDASHTHPVTIGSSSTATLASGGSGTSDATGAGANEPPFMNVGIRENTDAAESLPVGIIGIWRGSLGSIPDFWSLCDGSNGTPDLRARYLKGATSSIGTTGGSASGHTHTTPTHTHTTSGHTHTVTVGAQTAAVSGVSTTATVSVSTGTHTHTHADTGSTTPTVQNATSDTLPSATSEPPYEEVAFVQLTEEPTPPPDPDLLCLEWSDDYHLIRTEGPDGPMWVSIGGLINWDVERPFTANTGVMGGRFVTSAAPGGRNLKLSTAVSSEAELVALQAVLNRPLVLVSPSDSAEVWAVPVVSSVRVVKVGRIREVTVEFIATGPQPEPQLADVGS